MFFANQALDFRGHFTSYYMSHFPPPYKYSMDQFFSAIESLKRRKKGEDKLALNLQRRICMQNNVDTPNQKQSKQRNTILHANCHGRAAILGNNAKCIPLHERMSLSRTCIHINSDQWNIGKFVFASTFLDCWSLHNLNQMESVVL